MFVASYRDLQVWQLGMEIARGVYETTATFPSQEQFGLTSQMRRCAVSIPSNLAEGHQRETTKDFLRFIAIARGSLAELETQVLLSADLAYAAAAQVRHLLDLCDQEGCMLRALSRSLRKR